MPIDSEVIQRQHFCHNGDTICLPKSGYATTKLHGTSRPLHVDATIMRSFQTELFSRFLPSAYSGNVNLVAIYSLGSSCQSTEMATLLNRIYFVFNIHFCLKWRVIYYDYTVKWCSLVNSNLCALLDIV